MLRWKERIMLRGERKKFCVEGEGENGVEGKGLLSG